MSSVEREWAFSPWGILLNANKVLYIQRMEVRLSKDNESGYNSALEVLNILLTRPDENAYKIACLFNFFKDPGNLVEALRSSVSVTTIKTYKWQQVLPAGHWSTGGDLYVNCASSEGKIRKEITTEGAWVPSLFLEDVNGQPKAVIKSFEGDFLVLGLGWGITQQGVVIAPGVWYYPLVEEGERLVFKGRKALGENRVWLFPTRPWSGKWRNHWGSDFPNHAVMEWGDQDNQKDLDEFHEVAEALRRKFHNRMAVCL